MISPTALHGHPRPRPAAGLSRQFLTTRRVGHVPARSYLLRCSEPVGEAASSSACLTDKVPSGSLERRRAHRRLHLGKDGAAHWPALCGNRRRVVVGPAFFCGSRTARSAGTPRAGRTDLMSKTTTNTKPILPSSICLRVSAGSEGEVWIVEAQRADEHLCARIAISKYDCGCTSEEIEVSVGEERDHAQLADSVGALSDALLVAAEFITEKR